MEAFIQQASVPFQLLLQPWTMQSEDLTAGFTTRNGGVSELPFDTFNIGLHVNDDPNLVLRNRKHLAESLGFSFESWTCGEQVHGDRIAIVHANDRGRGRASMADTLPGVDGLITNVPNILLTSFYADCVPLYFWDKKRSVIGLAHAGWRGTVLGIASHMIEKMNAVYGTRPEELYCAIGPSIGACCYEVDNTVIEQIQELWLRQALPDELFAQVVISRDGGHAQINLKEINRQIMIKAGILASHIEISEWCTGCNRQLFYSHRLEQGKTGRMASWIGLRKG